MNIAQAAVGELIAMAGYALLCVGLYKLFQIANHLGEIKALLQKTGRSTAFDHAVLPVDDDSATEYAQNLLRAVNAESGRSENETAKSAEPLAAPPA